MHIKSAQHPYIKHLVELRKNGNYRKEKKRLLLTGKKILSEISERYPIDTLILSPSFSSSISAKNTVVVEERLFLKITGLKTPEPIAAELAMPEESFLFDKKALLILDRIQDPGNLGTLLRTAYGFGWEGVLYTENSCDPFMEKALRAARGASLFLPYAFVTKEEIENFLKQKKQRAYLADIEGKAPPSVFPEERYLILSSESLGPGDWEKSVVEKISLPTRIESLNVAIAGGILLYLMRPV